MESATRLSPPATSPGVEQRFLHALLRAASAHIEAFPTDAADLWLERGVKVLSANYAAQRFDLELNGRPGAPTLLAYAEQVLGGMLAEWDRVELIHQGDAGTWNAIRQRMERMAYRWLGPHGRQEWAAWEAREVASKTCSDLWLWLQSHVFPFDVPFDRWATRALVNRLHEAARKLKIRSQHEVESLDRHIFEHDVTVGETLVQYSLDAWLAEAANREVLLQALGQLDERTSAVLRLWYLEGWGGDEIAATLRITLNNVYIIRFRGLEKLRKFLTNDERFGLAEALQRVEAKKRRLPPDTVALESEAPDG